LVKRITWLSLALLQNALFLGIPKSSVQQDPYFFLRKENTHISLVLMSGNWKYRNFFGQKNKNVFKKEKTFIICNKSNCFCFLNSRQTAKRKPTLAFLLEFVSFLQVFWFGWTRQKKESQWSKKTFFVVVAQGEQIKWYYQNFLTLE
jgi:hypothetical protein